MYAYHCICENNHKIFQILTFSIIISEMLYKSLQFFSENLSPFFLTYILILFVCLSLYLRFYQKMSSILSIILCNPQFYHTYVRWKSTVLSENVSSSFFDCILFVFLCFSLHLSLFQKTLNFINYLELSSIFSYMLEENLQFYRKISPLLFKNTF